MPLIPLGTNDWSSAAENHQRFRLHNMYLTDNPTTPDGVSRVSRPTLTPFMTVGAGPIAGIWKQEGVLGGLWFIVSGDELFTYDETTGTLTDVDNVPGTGYCQFAGTADKVIIVRDGYAYFTDGATVGVVLMPDDVDPWTPNPAKVSSVATINSYFLLGVLDTQRFYWINPGDTDPDPLSFASAERIPDAIKSIHVISDEVWFVGASGPEVWSTTGDADLPFQRINGRVYSDGCIERDTSINVVFNSLPAIIWVTDTSSVVVAQGQITKISNESVEEVLKTATTLRAWFFRHNRHDFYVLTTDQFSVVFDLMKGSWAKWDTFNLLNWQAHLGLQSNGVAYAGDATTNQIWLLEEGFADGTLPVVREVSGTFDNFGARQFCNNVYARVNAGWSPSYGFEPVLEMRFSDDQGGSWSDYYSASLGDKGEYFTSVQFRSLGAIQRPGRTFEFRFSDFARFRLDYASINEMN